MRQSILPFIPFLIILCCAATLRAVGPDEFSDPPDSARPWVYWFIMDGNLSREGITADLEAMREQGIGGVILMEVNLGIPRGKVDFMSETWQELFSHAVHETERLGMQLTLNSGPGWTGSGGPWIAPEQSMLHLVASELSVQGPRVLQETLPNPVPRRPFFGEGALPPDAEKARKEFFKDVRVLAFPTPEGHTRVADLDEKALFVRAPYSSAPGVKPRIESPVDFEPVPAAETVDPARIVDLTDRLDASGVLRWNVPEGDWTILRFAATTTGANTRPAPQPGLGLECSKMDREAFDVHYANFIGKLFEAVGPRRTDGQAGWCYFHIDSWEMGPQNFSMGFLDEFRKRRDYDPVPFLPAYHGLIVDSPERTERFLWDLRQTAQELVIENHGQYLRDVSHRHGLKLSIEPYDMMPCCDMAFGSLADLPMCEFWSDGYGFNTVFSCFEATSIAHTHGKNLVAAESFTSSHDAWRQNPKSMKRQTDWAFGTGINRIVFHRFQHQPYLDRVPGFSMGIHGVHWDRTQTWWPLISGYHQYLARCQHTLQQGVAVVDVLYLLPEGAPQVFTPPESALSGEGVMRDQRGYRFDGCDPGTLMTLANVDADGRIAFPGGTKYRLLVLPEVETMTLPLLQKIEQLVRDGATIVGPPPRRSPGLQNYPQVDVDVRELAAKLWGDDSSTSRDYGKGRVIVPARRQPPQTPLRMAGAKWIWFPEGNPAHDAPPGTRYFRKTCTLPENARVVDARMLGIADNSLTVKVNGNAVESIGLHEALRIAKFETALKPGGNTLELVATNAPSDQRNPAGVIANFEISYADESGAETTWRASTDASWQTSQDGTHWQNALELGDFGIGPWSVAEHSAAGTRELYPAYGLTAEILACDGVAVDFDSPGDALRFFHKTDGESDTYFVANRTDQPFDGDVNFRVNGKRASIRDPLTGRVFAALPAQVNRATGQTTFRLALDGSQAVFVVFDRQGVPDDTPVWQKRNEAPLLELAGDWQVAFDPKRGGPGEVRFERLTDWSKHETDGIRHYSGIATYAKSFEITAPQIAAGKRFTLDLGEVEVMARVRLNGKQVGTRWVGPYRLDVTDFLREGGNELVVEVANLWPNRLIGDAARPESERITWSTWHDAYKADSPLLPSGLIGPVRILVSE